MNNFEFRKQMRHKRRGGSNKIITNIRVLRIIEIRPIDTELLAAAAMLAGWLA